MGPRQNAPPAFPANDSSRPAAFMPQGLRERKTMNDETEIEIQTVPAAAAEVLAERYARLIRWVVFGWATSAAALIAVIAWAL